MWGPDDFSDTNVQDQRMWCFTK